MVVLRVQGEHLDLDQCLRWIPEIYLESQWRVGSMRVGGRVNATSGFALLLSEDENEEQMVETAKTVFQEVAARITELVESGATAELDLGLMITGNGSQSVKFGPEFLELLQRSGVSLIVSAYPCSDSDE